MRFDELSLDPVLLRNVAAMGYEIPTPIQQQAIPPALEGRDVLGRAPTGTGKTAAFMLPTLNRLRGKEGLRALVICPTRELAMQVAENATQYARGTELFVTVVYGGTPLQKAYTVIATFSVGMSQYDQAYIYMPLGQAQLFFGREDTADAIEIKVADPDKAPKMRAAINKAAGPAALLA